MNYFWASRTTFGPALSEIQTPFAIFGMTVLTATLPWPVTLAKDSSSETKLNIVLATKPRKIQKQVYRPAPRIIESSKYQISPVPDSPPFPSLEWAALEHFERQTQRVAQRFPPWHLETMAMDGDTVIA